MKPMTNPLVSILGSGKELEQTVVGGPIDAPVSAQSKRQIRAPVMWGLGIMGLFFLGFGIWAAVAPISGAVSASGVIKVEANKKTLKSRDGGVVREINVREGDRVLPGQTLIKFDDTNYAAQVDIFENQLNTLSMQSARLQAEVIGGELIIPPKLAARRSEPGVANAINIETTVFNARRSAYEGQLSILRQRISQLNSVKSGLDIQVSAIGEGFCVACYCQQASKAGCRSSGASRRASFRDKSQPPASWRSATASCQSATTTRFRSCGYAYRC
jgi:multidrug efflux pump subunit AcrA (membrane-fusion protein)